MGLNKLHFMSALIITICFVCAALMVSNHSNNSNAVNTSMNLVVITSDTTRSDCLGTYGSSMVRMPNLDRFAREGITFENHYATTWCTLPAHASIFTGLYPDKHYVYSNDLSLPQNIPTLGAILSGNNYECEGYCATYILKGVSNGFRHMSLPSSDQGWRRSGAQLDSAIQFMEKTTRKGTPFFLWFHSYDPHYPYAPPAPYHRMYEELSINEHIINYNEYSQNLVMGYRPNISPDYTLSQYLGELSYWDSQIGKLIHCIRKIGNTLVVFIGDHGENLGEFSMYGHCFPSEEVIKTPMIFWHTDPELFRSDKNGIQGFTVQQTDVLPTVLDYLDIPTSNSLQHDGVNLKKIINGNKEPSQRLAFSLTTAYLTTVDCQSNYKYRKKFSAKKDPDLNKIEAFTQYEKFLSEDVNLTHIPEDECYLLSHKFCPTMRNKPVSKIEFTAIMTAANDIPFIFVKELEKKDTFFEYQLPLPYYYSNFGHLIDEEYPLFMSSYPKYHYSLRLFDHANQLIWESPGWFENQYSPAGVNDQKEVLLHLLDSFVTVSKENMTKEQHSIFELLKEESSRFLSRNAKNTQYVELLSTDAYLLIPNTFITQLTPSEARKKYYENLNSVANSDVRNETVEALKRLGYIQ